MAALTAGRTDIGAVVSFTGLVRGQANGEALHAMTLEHYPGMTEKALLEIEREAQERFRLSGSLVVHRVGRLLPGDPIVLVLAAAPHRGDAFAGGEFLMDWLKTKAPFWKYEETDKGGQWVDARTSDDSRAARWDQPDKERG
jgi:molybdopterin synthase catalytic subunit